MSQDNSQYPVKGIYEHYKGGYYELLFIATDSETLEKKVVYKALYGNAEIWVRPLSMWNEYVTLQSGEKVRRFRLIESI